MTRCQILPTILMVIDIAAGVVYACDGNVKRAIYWFAAGVLTWSVTW